MNTTDRQKMDKNMLYGISNIMYMYRTTDGQRYITWHFKYDVQSGIK